LAPITSGESASARTAAADVAATPLVLRRTSDLASFEAIRVWSAIYRTHESPWTGRQRARPAPQPSSNGVDVRPAQGSRSG